MRKCVVLGLVATFLLTFVVLLAGCAPVHPSGVADTIPAVGTSLQKTNAYVESAQTLTKQAVPESNDVGKKLLTVASSQQQKALDTLKEADKQVQTAENERAAVEKKYSATSDELAKVKHGWGYRLQMFVAWAIWIVVSLFAFHFIGGLVALFFPGPIGGAIGLAATVVNPAAWFQSAKDHYFFRNVLPKQQAAGSEVSASA